MPNEETSNPQQHTANVKQMLNDVIRHLREDVGRIEEPRAEALFETTLYFDPLKAMSYSSKGIIYAFSGKLKP